MIDQIKESLELWIHPLLIEIADAYDCKDTESAGKFAVKLFTDWEKSRKSNLPDTLNVDDIKFELIMAGMVAYTAKQAFEKGHYFQAINGLAVSMRFWGQYDGAIRAKNNLSTTVSNNAKKRHAESYELKEQALAFFEENQGLFKSLDSAAEHISTKVVPISFRTARKWLGDHKKLRSASKK